MSTNLGNTLNQIVSGARGAMFEQGELAQLTFGAFDIAVSALQGSQEEQIELSIPIGYRPDRVPMTSRKSYRKEQLIDRYQFLAHHQLSVNAVVQLVTLVEALLSDVVRAVVIRYPHKLGGKRSMSVATVLEATSIEEVHLKATDALLNELGYKSPAEFAESCEQLLSVNLLECPAFHRYVEIKATRDIYIHNRGLANDVYIRKAGTHARVAVGRRLPVDGQYFLESYECCLQLTEWLELQLHDRWHSSEFEVRRTGQPSLPLPEPQAEAHEEAPANADISSSPGA